MKPKSRLKISFGRFRLKISLKQPLHFGLRCGGRRQPVVVVSFLRSSRSSRFLKFGRNTKRRRPNPKDKLTKLRTP
ncbi:hypothetical protein QVD17_19355 [Tagetes erecta]|uniref:Uncharacterized protein n=1 Tax=Tagetes erecta TaxID=13708 RepID=A0AAD8KJT6_TARER|nr:hypothetical protein QVD17_19355 [Tagetes erecta]